MIAESIIGGIVGLFGGLANGWMEVKKHRAETERLEKQWQHDEAMFAKQTDARREQNADDAFLASVQSGREPSPFNLPAGSPAWLLTPLVLVESIRRATRPLLTWCLVVAAYHNPAMSGLAGTAVGWWFGTRTTTYFLSK